ncbi:hypothetical protein GDO81_001569 [Engystomops pustulosus]|uniref:Uncharacterized protein n=1 Tax=Engystomops pustulosus TaxID=76066 RepID=A0AAV7DF20_ENGPU|nr:hypothetical protein GDO81_001569 [Engystomops pustulosus]
MCQKCIKKRDAMHRMNAAHKLLYMHSQVYINLCDCSYDMPPTYMTAFAPCQVCFKQTSEDLFVLSQNSMNCIFEKAPRM